MCVNVVVVAVSRHGSLVGAVRWLAVLEVAPRAHARHTGQPPDS